MFKHYDVSKDHPKKGLVGKGLPKMIEYYNKTLNFDSSWYVDQDIFSHEILSTGLCSLPKNHVLWEKLKIDPNLPRYVLLLKKSSFYYRIQNSQSKLEIKNKYEFRCEASFLGMQS